MSAKVLTSSVIGLEGRRVDVECDISQGLPAFHIVGLPDTAVQEARERVRSAMKHSDAPFPKTKITINLAPGDLKKSGTGFDLPMAIAILITHGDLPRYNPLKRLLIGELAFDGSLRPVRGALSTALLCEQLGIEELIVPMENAGEASMVKGIKIYSAASLSDVVRHISGLQKLTAAKHKKLIPSPNISCQNDFSGIRGQETAKRALEIAAAGGHNILLQGPPGSGKTMLARSFAGILPILTHEEALDVTRIHSVSGLLPKEGCITERPFRSPHHTASGASLVGGGSIPKPGEVSLAHRGVLFLDEFPEFSRHVLENLRQPLEDGFVTVSRAQGTTAFPARFVLIAAMNPCPCGFLTDQDKPCSCTTQQLLLYKKRLSGPLLDRIDLSIEVPKVPTEELVGLEAGESSRSVRARVQAARDRQREKLKAANMFTNAEMASDQVRQLIHLTSEARELMTRAVDKFRLSARAYFRLLKVAQTIADLASSDEVGADHISEALHYRRMPDA